jgi:hypothetical protein
VRWERVKQAAVTAVTDPWTWAPAAGAAAFAFEDWDQRASDWAVKHNPVFGSESFARDMSDYQRSALMGETFLTLTLTPSGEDAWGWAATKARGAAVEGAGLLATSGATGGLKSWTARDRPDESNNNSMPSAHSSSAFSAARLSNRNLESIRMSGAARTSLQALNFGLASSVAWARVEGKKH